MTEREQFRHTFRVGLFQRRGWTLEQATAWAERLTRRDADIDDRRICLECSCWQQSRTCFKRLPTSPDQLARCVGFTWQKP